jgi:hypothetical protein
MHNGYTSGEYYHTNKYDDLIKSELKIDSWVFLSEYIVFDPHTKRKFIIKEYIFKKTKWTLGASIPDECTNKTFQELQEKYLIAYEKFKTKYNVDIYPYIFDNITDVEILYYLKYCCNHDFLPDILLETDSFLEVEYLDSSEWRPSTPFERSSNSYLNCVNKYCSHIHDLQLCVTIDSHNCNIMVNRKTGKFKNIDIEDLWPPNHFVPNICWYSVTKYKEFSAYYILRNNYVWSIDFFNKSLDYYNDLLEIISTDRIYIEEKPIYCTDDYKNLRHKI